MRCSQTIRLFKKAIVLQPPLMGRSGNLYSSMISLQRWSKTNPQIIIRELLAKSPPHQDAM